VIFLWKVKWKFAEGHEIKSYIAEDENELHGVIQRIKDVGCILLSVEEISE
jgi:hypothetical protein